MAYPKLQAYRAAAVTPNDSADIPNIANQDGSGPVACVLYIGGAGNIKVTTAGGDDVTFNGLLAGTFFPVQVLRVWATGTTATNIIALW